MEKMKVKEETGPIYVKVPEVKPQRMRNLSEEKRGGLRLP